MDVVNGQFAWIRLSNSQSDHKFSPCSISLEYTYSLPGIYPLVITPIAKILELQF